MDQKIDTLRQVSIFHSMSEPHLKELARISVEKSYRANQVIFHQNDQGNILFILKTGAAKISVTDHEGKEVIFKMVYEKEFFGEMSLLDGFFRSATVTALKDSTALLIYRDAFIELIRENHSVVLDMLTVLCRRLRKTDEAITSLSFHDAYGKVAKVLLDLAESQGKHDRNTVVLDLNMSRTELSSMAGVARETFTRILNEFEIRGCLRMEKKRIVILDYAVLKRETL